VVPGSLGEHTWLWPCLFFALFSSEESFEFPLVLNVLSHVTMHGNYGTNGTTARPQDPRTSCACQKCV